jgi:hypothetical protein
MTNAESDKARNLADVDAMEEMDETFSLRGHTFYGAYSTAAALASMPGVYVVWCERRITWKVLDVDESEDVRERVANHERTACWKRNCRGAGSIRYCAFYSSNKTKRKLLVEKIRRIARPPCGEDAPSEEPNSVLSPSCESGI